MGSTEFLIRLYIDYIPRKTSKDVVDIDAVGVSSVLDEPLDAR